MDELLTQVSFIFAWPEDTPHDGVGSRVGLGPPLGFSPLFTLEFSQHKKNFPPESRCQPSPSAKWVIWCL